METKQIEIFGEEWIARNGDVVALNYSECASCGSNWFPQKEICPTCFSEHYEMKTLTELGEVYSFTTLTVTSKRFQAPLQIAYVDFPGNIRVCGQVEGTVQIGQKVKVIFGQIAQQKDGTEVWSYKFKVVE